MDTRKAWDHHGRTRHDRGYGSGWDKLRLRVLLDEPLCYLCKAAPSTTVDHVIPKVQGGTDDRANLRGACSACQQSKAAREGARGARKW